MIIQDLFRGLIFFGCVYICSILLLALVPKILGIVSYSVSGMLKLILFPVFSVWANISLKRRKKGITPGLLTYDLQNVFATSVILSSNFGKKTLSIKALDGTKKYVFFVAIIVTGLFYAFPENALFNTRAVTTLVGSTDTFIKQYFNFEGSKPSPYSQYKIYFLVTANIGANIRGDATVDAPVIGGVSKGEKILYLDEEKRDREKQIWYKIKFEDKFGIKEGWINSNLVEKINN